MDGAGDKAAAFGLLLASHLVAARYSAVQDCDEVFNYWEATHYLSHGGGLQTWEYSPEFAIRSWAYAALHALVTPAARLLRRLLLLLPPTAAAAAAAATPPRVVEFYLLRAALAGVCAVCETALFARLSGLLGPRVARLYLVVTLTSPGMYHAAVAYLPSSFAMYCVALGTAAFMDRRRAAAATARGVWCFGVGACLAWPFAAAMAVPFLLDEALRAARAGWAGQRALAGRVADGVGRTLLGLGVQVGVDSFFYRRLVVAPLNIVRYNLVGGAKGPDLYGTEPWHFYLRNLALNFHLWFLLALASMPLLCATRFVPHAKGAPRAGHRRTLVLLTPFYLWLAIFTLQPHKEERFMYPAYPALALNAAVTFHILLANLGSTAGDARGWVGRIPVRLRLLAVVGFVSLATALAASRVLGTMTAYGAPLSIYQPLHRPGVSRPGDRVCLGKEWYRFPSHYLLPDGVRARFIRSEFTGLLPGEFSEAGPGSGWFPGAGRVPPGMNDDNREDVGKYTDLARCDFLVDLNLPSTRATDREPNFIADHRHWDRVECLPFLDAASTGVVARLGWLPHLPFLPPRYSTRVYGEYCLLKRRTQQPRTPNTHTAP